MDEEKSQRNTFAFQTFPVNRSMKRSHSIDSRSSSSSDSGSSNLEDFKTIPSSTSRWTTECLEMLGIFYDDNYLSSPSAILDMVFEKREIFGPLTDDQHNYVEKVKTSITFSSSIEEIIAIQDEDVDMLLSDKLLPEMKTDIDNVRMEMTSSLTENVHTVAEDFIFNARHMIMCEVAYIKDMDYRESQGPASKDIFIEIVRMFGRMCRLSVIPGSTWKGKMDIKKVPVTSAADLVLMPLNFYDEPLGKSTPHPSAVVSVVEVQNLHRSHGETESSTVGSVPAIYNKVSSRVLGHHGGDLLLYYRLYVEKLKDNRKKWRYFPGILVIGTEVIFTLMEINTPHLVELKTDDSKPISHIAKIYYSEPKDLLRKEDRDLLLEYFMRLNNV